jgi:MFS family permease
MFMMQMFYYRTQFTLDTFGVSLQINTIVVGCTEVFANVLFTKFLQSMKRRLSLRVEIVSLMVLLLFLIASSERWVQTVVEGSMRLVDTAIMIVLGVYVPELFKVGEKGRGTNFVMSFGVIGSALNGKIFSHLPFWSLELFLLAALATTLLLK